MVHLGGDRWNRKGARCAKCVAKHTICGQVFSMVGDHRQGISPQTLLFARFFASFASSRFKAE
jgi:hypothetical protein